MITYLNTSYKIFTELLGKHMKDHADRNEIWDKSQLGTCSGGTRSSMGNWGIQAKTTNKKFEIL